MASVVVSLLHSLPFPVRSRVAAPRNPRAPTPAHGCQSIARSTPPLDHRRPDAVGVALASLARLAVGGSDRQTGDRRRLAPTRLWPILDVEKPPAHRTTGCASRPARPDPRAVDRESPLGCASDPRRTAEVGNRRESVDRREVHTAASVARRLKPGGPSSPTTRARLWPPTCSSCRQSHSGCCSCWSTSGTPVDESSMQGRH